MNSFIPDLPGCIVRIRQDSTALTVLAFLHVLLSAIGGALGLLFARWGTQALLALMSRGENHMILDVKPDRNVLLFTLAASVLTGILFGLAPAFRAARVELASAMKESAGNISEGHGGHFFGKSLVVAQISASLVLMIGAGLFVRTSGYNVWKNYNPPGGRHVPSVRAPAAAGL